MTFGRRSAERIDVENVEASTPVSPWLIAAGLAIFLSAAGYAMVRLGEVDHTATLEQAAIGQGVTDEVRAKLRQDFAKALIEMERELCDEWLRDRAGKQAVLYYETLLEKPVIAAGLEMTYHNRCQPKLNRNSHPFERLINGGGLGSNLTLPWDCLPDHWRTPTDRALQAALESVLRAGHLTNDSLTGTLALIARPTMLGPLPGLCRRPPPDIYQRPNLPLIAEPTDDWDRRSRRRRY